MCWVLFFANACACVQGPNGRRILKPRHRIPRSEVVVDPAAEERRRLLQLVATLRTQVARLEEAIRRQGLRHDSMILQLSTIAQRNKLTLNALTKRMGVSQKQQRMSGAPRMGGV